MDGSQISLTRLGGFYNAPPEWGGGVVTPMTGVFSRNSDMITTDDSMQPQPVHRVPGAISMGADTVVGPLMDWSTWTEIGPRDIDEDFTISGGGGDPATPQGVNITIPAGARYLFVSSSDPTVWDNSPWEGGYALRITALRASPVAGNDAYSTTEDTTLTVPVPGVLGNDTDANADVLTAQAASGPANGTLTLNPNGSFVYTPNADFHGTDTFTYKVNDGTADSNIATVTLTVNPVNDVPDAVDDPNASTPVNTPITVNVLANDTDVDGDALTVTAIAQPANGTTSIAADGKTVTYTPRTGYTGTNTFTYTISDGKLTDTAKVTVTVTGPNRAPVAVNDTAKTTPLNTVNIPVLANDSDPDGDPLIVTIVTQPKNGKVTIAQDGKSVDFKSLTTGTTRTNFTYTISDGRGKTATATVNVTVTY